MQWLDAPADKYNMCVSAAPQSLFARDFVKDYKIIKRHDNSTSTSKKSSSIRAWNCYYPCS